MPCNVLVVEDDNDIREIICEVLLSDGFGVEAAEHGAAALAMLERQAAIDVILLDLQMPVMDGWEFLRRKAADPRLAPIPVTIISGTVVSPLPSGVRAVAVKPARIEELEELVKAMCREIHGEPAARVA